MTETKIRNSYKSGQIKIPKQGIVSEINLYHLAKTGGR